MFYISSRKYKGSVELWGVTDTRDGVEEFFTKGMLGKFFKEQGVRIEGLVYTGSDFHCYIKNLSIIALENLSKGDVFILSSGETDKYVLYIGRDALDSFIVFDGKSTSKLTRKALLSGNYTIKTDKLDADKEISLRQSYIKAVPTSTLSLHLQGVI